MAGRIVLQAQALDPFLLAIKTVLTKRGLSVVQSNEISAQDLHIVTDPDLTGPNILQVIRLPVAPYRAFQHPALRQTFVPDAIPYPPAKTFFEKLRADYANGQRFAVADLPSGLLVVCIACEDDPDHDDANDQMISDAVATGRPVVLVCDDPLQSGCLAPFANKFPSVLIHHEQIADLLHKTDVVLSRAGAGVILAHIHRTPAVLYAPTPFDHISPVISATLDFETALEQALRTDGVYAKYLHWYFQTQAMRSDASDFADRLIVTFDALGFGRAKLGLEVASGIMRTVATTHTAAQTLTQFLEAQPDLKTVRLTKTLKVSDQSWVFKARVNGEKVVVKRFHDSDPAHTVRSLQGELALVQETFGDGPNRVNQCLYAWPEEGTVILSHAPGKRMVDVIAAASGAKRAALLQKAGGWLNAYAEPRNRETSFGPRYWVKDLDSRPRHKLEIDGHALFDRALVKLNQLAQRTMGTPVVQAATHGDYAGINVHFHKDIMTGVDIQGECWQALARDATRFLVWQALHDPRDTGMRIFGIDAPDLKAFLSGLPLIAEEHATTVPFFLGLNMLHRYLDKVDRGADAGPEITLLQAYLTDLDADLDRLAAARVSPDSH